MQLIENHHSTITTVLGEGWKTVYLAQSTIHQIMVSSATAGTVFSVSIENALGDEIFLSEGNTGWCNESVEIPTATNCTLYIKDASANEVFEYTIVIKVN